MNNRKYLRLVGQLTTTCRKVFDAIPKQEAWTAPLIFAELKREGVKLDFAMVEGCLNSLVRDGLVRESKRGQFQAVHEPPKTTMAEALLDAVSHVTALDPPTDLDDEEEPPMAGTALNTKPLSEIDELLARMGNLSGVLRAAAQEVDDVALQVAGALERSKGNNAQLEALKATLREVLA